MDNTNKPSIRGYIGSSGSGKGVSVRAMLKAEKPKRLVVWDPLNEYGAFCTVRTDSIAVMARTMDRPSFTVAFFPGKKVRDFGPVFEDFCRCVWSAGNCMALVEELSDVTTPSLAPPLWAQLTRKGRHRGLQLVACTQRPAKIDKDFLGSASYLRCFTLRYPDDQRALASVMGVPTAVVAGLTTIQDEKATVIRYLERDFLAGAAKEGQIRLTRR